MQPLAFSTDMLTDVLEGNASLPELARKLKVALADFLDWFFTEPVQRYVNMYKAANLLIAEARISVNAPALIDRLRQQMGHPDPSLSIRASNTLAEFVLREMRPHAHKAATESRKLQDAPLPEQPGYAAGLERAAKAREEEFRAFRPDERTTTVSPTAAPKPVTTAPSITAPTPHAHPAQAHPAPRDATPLPESSLPIPDQPTQLQTPAPEPLLLQPPDPSPHHTRDRTTPHPEACAA